MRSCAGKLHIGIDFFTTSMSMCAQYASGCGAVSRGIHGTSVSTMTPKSACGRKSATRKPPKPANSRPMLMTGAFSNTRMPATCDSFWMASDVRFPLPP